MENIGSFLYQHSHIWGGGEAQGSNMLQIHKAMFLLRAVFLKNVTRGWQFLARVSLPKKGYGTSNLCIHTPEPSGSHIWLDLPQNLRIFDQLGDKQLLKKDLWPLQLYN